METFLIALVILFISVISVCCFKVYKIKSATRNLIDSLGGIETIFSPLVREISRVFICYNISYLWNRVIVCDAPVGVYSKI